MSSSNPLKPLECKRTVSLETGICHHEIQERKLQGKREAYKRRNEMYLKAVYGSPQEKEEVKWVKLSFTESVTEPSCKYF